MTLALLFAGVATFGELYSPQPLLPQISQDMGVSEASASLAISISTGALALSVLPWAAIGDRIGRARAMTVSAVITAIISAVIPFVHTFGQLLVLRAIAGLALGAIPALAIAYLLRRVHEPRASAIAGIYVAGTTVGGMSGRLLSGLVGAASGSWRTGMVTISALVVISSIIFVVLLPREPARLSDASSNPPPLSPAQRLWAAVASAQAWGCYLQGFLLMGAFVSVYNLLSYRLLGPEYALPATWVALLFLTYLVGTVSSANVGRLVKRFGRRASMASGGVLVAIGGLLTVAHPLWLVMLGVAVMTWGMFVAHPLASAGAGEAVPQARSQSTAFYSLCYYMGSSLLGWLAALLYGRHAWAGVAVLVATSGIAAALLAGFVACRQVPPTPPD